MPMVFSATALSMPALEASRPINSSIFCPVPNRFNRVVCLKNDLERPRSEIQAINAHQGDVVLDSRGECCSNARVNARFIQSYCAAPWFFLPEVGKKYERYGHWCAATVLLTVSII